VGSLELDTGLQMWPR